MGKSKKLMEKGESSKNIVNKHSRVNIINKTTTCPHITVNRYRIIDSGSILHCYLRDMPTDNDFPAAAFHAVQLDGYKIVSTFQADMKLPTLNKEARKGYKFPALT